MYKSESVDEKIYGNKKTTTAIHRMWVVYIQLCLLLISILFFVRNVHFAPWCTATIYTSHSHSWQTANTHTLTWRKISRTANRLSFRSSSSSSLAAGAATAILVYFYCTHKIYTPSREIAEWNMRSNNSKMCHRIRWWYRVPSTVSGEHTSISSKSQ